MEVKLLKNKEEKETKKVEKKEEDKQLKEVLKVLKNVDENLVFSYKKNFYQSKINSGTLLGYKKVAKDIDFEECNYFIYNAENKTLFKALWLKDKTLIKQLEKSLKIEFKIEK